MIISIKVKTKTKENKIIKTDTDNVWKIYIKECAEKGKANNELINLLSDKLDVSKSRISIISGKKSHNKLIEIK
jgi:uncharacterized protein (TIGR00251 family)